jgi:hypothetical protein
MSGKFQKEIEREQCVYPQGGAVKVGRNFFAGNLENKCAKRQETLDKEGNTFEAGQLLLPDDSIFFRFADFFKKR